MAEAEQWYVKAEDGAEYGPAPFDDLVRWAREGRIEPSGLVSADRKNWKPASLLPELGMRFVVEAEPGQYYGPVHQAVLKELVDTKQLSASARIYRLDDGDEEKAKSEAEKAKAEVERRLAESEEALAKVDELLGLLESAKGREATLAKELESAKGEAERSKAETRMATDAARADIRRVKVDAEREIVSIGAELAAVRARACVLARRRGISSTSDIGTLH